MRRSLIVLALAGALSLGAVSAFAAPSEFKATGGGQTLIGTNGAGNTIAFTAQGNPEAAKGQVQVIDRTAGRGQDQVKFHGIVECILVEGNSAEIAGQERDTGQPFTLRVVDNGEGAAADNDLIFFDDVEDDPECESGDEDDEDPDIELARGNVQVHRVR